MAALPYPAYEIASGTRISIREMCRMAALPYPAYETASGTRTGYPGNAPYPDYEIVRVF